jgi:hypothetical protein
MSITNASSSVSAIANECSICLEEYNRNTHTQVKCEYCPMNACRSCCERYILQNNMIKCMDIKCNREWTRKYIISQFTQSFINGPLKKHRQNIIFEKERKTFPATIQKMARLQSIKDDLYTILDILQKTIIKTDKSLYHNILSITNLLFDKPIKRDIQLNFDYISVFFYHVHYHVERIYNIIHRYAATLIDDNTIINGYVDDSVIANIEHLINQQHIAHIFNVINNIICSNREIVEDTVSTADVEIKYTNQCPTSSCNGVLDANWYCILCKTTTCAECHEKKEEEHKCESNTVETIKLLKTDTKPCPKCKANIYKIDGCDQMWCTNCRTAFSWKTGAIETKIHNPHYYQWLRSKSVNGEIPRNEGQHNEGEQCDDTELNMYHNNSLITYINNYIKDIHDKDIENKRLYRFEDDTRHVIHMRQAVLPEFDETNHIITIDTYLKMSMKMNYLHKKIDDNEYKSFLEQEENKKDMNIEVHQLVQTWIVIKTDILKRFMYRIRMAVRNNNKMTFDDIEYELDELKVFMKMNLREIESTYKNKINIEVF